VTRFSPLRPSGAGSPRLAGAPLRSWLAVLQLGNRPHAAWLRHPAEHGQPRRRLWQRPSRKLHVDPQNRARRPPLLAHPQRRPASHLRLHRRLVQPPRPTLSPRPHEPRRPRKDHKAATPP